MRYEPTVRNGDVTQGDPRPSEVVTYQLTPEELIRYGPPSTAVKRPAGLSPWPAKRGGDKNMANKPVINQDFVEAAIQAAEAEVAAKMDKPPATTKRCNKCGVDKPLDQYRKGHGACRACEVADSQRRYAAKKAAKKAKQATLAAAGPATASDIADAIPAAIPMPAPKPSPAVIDYVAQHGMTLEVTGPGTLVIANVYAAVDLLDEARRYRLTMSVEEA